MEKRAGERSQIHHRFCRISAVSYTHLATLVANEFIDRYMADANGEYVKVYLYLLRHHQEKPDVGQIADDLNHTAVSYTHLDVYKRQANTGAGSKLS